MRFIRIVKENTEALIEMTSVRARELGRALIAAADEVKKMVGYDQMSTD